VGSWKMTIDVRAPSFDGLKLAASRALRSVEGAKSFRAMPQGEAFTYGHSQCDWYCSYTCPDEDRIQQLRKEVDELEEKLRS
jgi:hypothetical protein